MPRIDTRPTPYRKTPSVDAEWKGFRKGVNMILRPTELDNSEMAEATNLMLVGSGTPTGRWGTAPYFTLGNSGRVRGLGTYKSNDGTTNDIIGLTDEGYLYKKDGTSSTLVTGQSWPSGSIIRTEQLGGKTYIVSKDVAFTEYDGTDLSVYATISPPTGLSATNFSGASGTNRVSWKVVAVAENGGQTTPSTNYVLTNLPTDLSKTQVNLFWTAPSAVTLAGYEIYRGTEGDETYLASTPAGTTTYQDKGEPASQTIEAPIANTTGGVKSDIIVKYKDRILLVPADDPNKLMISGRYTNQTKFSWTYGGGSIYIDPDSGDTITAISVQPIADRIIVYKNRSSYAVELSLVTIGNFTVLDPQYAPISTSVGACNPDVLATVENDTFYFGRDGIYVTGYEPNFLNILRTNEVSAKIRPYLDLLNAEDYETANASYIDNKYILSFPRRKEMVVYDRERGAFLGIWQLPYGISKIMKYVDDTDSEKWIIASYEDNHVYTFESSLNSDSGTTIVKTLKTKKEYFGDWTKLYILQYFYILFRAITGSTTVNIVVEDRNGVTSTAKSFTITGSATSGFTGWGMSQWGMSQWGLSSSNTAIGSSDEITRWGPLFKPCRLVQIQVTSTENNSNFELLQILLSASKGSRGVLSNDQRA